MESIPLSDSEILFRDDSVLVLNKPAGIPMHASRILADQPDTLLMLARQRVGHMVFMVHRLDRPVSGTVVMACNKEAQAGLGHQFENRQVEKCYLSIVRGWTDPSGEIDHPLMPPPDDRKPGSVARNAMTRYERIAQTELPVPVAPYSTARYSLLALYPETGRRHQLRRHMKHISHHMIGDTTYGRGEHNRMFREKLQCHRLLLHSWALSFSHPVNSNPLQFHAPLDSDFRKIVDQLGWAGDLAAWHKAHFPGRLTSAQGNNDQPST